ncbi:MAG TPA: UDP-N-acetylmuramate dehydrogenase [Candidatus Limnocylindrales bacterium]|nr:UDP-N-acetylmuramate dehydrogenase [Candidatus Limnocylindrales bacterium]
MTGPAAVPALDLIALSGDIARRIGVKAERAAPLAKLTTMRVGGPADLLVTAHNGFELRALIRFARARSIPLTLLGRGSNVVISDRGIRGLVVHVRAEGSRIEGETYTAEAGVPMARAATETQKAGLSGLEFGLAVPGSVGGAVWANAGAHGSDVKAVVESADVLLADGSEQRLGAADLGLDYRESRFKGQPADGTGDIVLGARFRLEPAAAEVIKERLDEIRKWRQAHQPLGIPSGGSTFRNPEEGPSAGALIEGAGLKGLQLGGATVSEKHANFVINDRKGSAADVRRLVDLVQARVREQAGVELVPEIVFLGDWEGWPWPEASA